MFCILVLLEGGIGLTFYCQTLLQAFICENRMCPRIYSNIYGEWAPTSYSYLDWVISGGSWSSLTLEFSRRKINFLVRFPKVIALSLFLSLNCLLVLTAKKQKRTPKQMPAYQMKNRFSFCPSYPHIFSIVVHNDIKQ